MSLAGPLISAGASLLGGLFGRKKEKVIPADENSRLALMGQAQGARDAGAKYGFNPLTLLGVSAPMGPTIYGGGVNPMGAAFADAGAALANGITAQQQRKDALSEAQAQNKKLREQLNSATIRPRRARQLCGGQLAAARSLGYPGVLPRHHSNSERRYGRMVER
jgi:hypothetical protein